MVNVARLLLFNSDSIAIFFTIYYFCYFNKILTSVTFSIIYLFTLFICRFAFLHLAFELFFYMFAFCHFVDWCKGQGYIGDLLTPIFIMILSYLGPLFIS